MLSIVTVIPCILIESPGFQSTITFQAADMEQPDKLTTCLGGSDGMNYTVLSTTANAAPGWYSATVVWNGLGNGRGEFIPALFFGVDISITIICGDETAGPFPVPAFEVPIN